ncbi:MAG: hypothetical protein ABI419_05915, partial [Ginsengibacter sp.]
YLFSGVPVSEYTSIGCHTCLWDYNNNDYHHWVYAENIDKILPPIVSTDTIFNKEISGKALNIGTGIHDSSAALLPYALSSTKPFLLISTGTWSISLNPFSGQILTKDDLENDCLHYMRTDGKPVRSSRLLLGSEYSLQVEKLATHFNRNKDYHKEVAFDENIFQNHLTTGGHFFHFECIHLPRPQPLKNSYDTFRNFEEGYHALMIELVELQVESAKRAIGNSAIELIYIDGGFVGNEIYIRILTHHFPQYAIYSTRAPLGSALGAAMIISEKTTDDNFLKEYYDLHQHVIDF